MVAVVMEVLVRILAWLIQIGAVLLTAMVLTGGIVWGVERAIRKKRVRFLPHFLGVLLAVCILLTLSAVRPMVICNEDLPQEQKDVVQSQAADLYSWSIPLVPIFVRVHHIADRGTEYRMEYTIHYFCAGACRMEYSSVDGYNALSMSLF